MPAPSPRVLTSSASVWKHLAARGGLDIDRYDSGLVADLRRQLRLADPGRRSNPSTHLQEQLGTRQVPVETFLEAFFRSIAPYAAMFAELLGMFARAGARQSNEHLRVSFDFGSGVKGLDFDLEQFRSWSLQWSQVVRSENT